MGRKPKNPDQKKTGNYLDKNEFREEILKCRENDELSDKLTRMFITLANNVSNRMYYADPQDKEDCVSTALMACVKYWKSYNPEKSDNPFAYFTSVCTLGLCKGWKDLQKGKSPDSLSIPISESIFSL